jgi:hypothetical protein
MTPALFYSTILVPAATTLATYQPSLDSPEARCMMLAIAGQESNWTDRIQIPSGFARGFWQCEEQGAVFDVIGEHDLALICGIYSINVTPATVWDAIGYNDLVAYTVGRLRLWQDTATLPKIGDTAGSYAYYLRDWAPGAPSPTRWATVYPQAVAVINGGVAT